MSTKPFIPLFRAYDPKSGLIRQFDPMYDVDDGALLAGMNHPMHCLDLSSNDVVVTTSTGYFDRNGTPIFEGDKIRNSLYSGDFPVCHGPFGWYAGNEEGGIAITEGGFFSSHEDGTPRYERCGWLRNVEIVGNIWNAK